MADERNRLLSICESAIKNAHQCIQNQDVRPEVIISNLNRAKYSLNVLESEYNMNPLVSRDIRHAIHTLQQKLGPLIVSSGSNAGYQASTISTGWFKSMFDIYVTFP